MSKAIILVLAVLAVSFATTPMDAIRDIVKDDTCAIDSMKVIQPEIDAAVAELKENPKSVEARAKLLVLIEKTKAIYEKCELNNKVEAQLGDVVEATGVAFLLASNCFKDVGIVFLIADTIIQDPTDWTNDIIVSIFLYILGRQGVADCSKFIGFII